MSDKKVKSLFYDRIMARYLDCAFASRKAETGSQSSLEMETCQEPWRIPTIFGNNVADSDAFERLVWYRIHPF